MGEKMNEIVHAEQTVQPIDKHIRDCIAPRSWEIPLKEIFEAKSNNMEMYDHNIGTLRQGILRIEQDPIIKQGNDTLGKLQTPDPI